MIDLRAQELEEGHVEVNISLNGKIIWINIDGICRLRAANLKSITIDDERAPTTTADKRLPIRR